MDPRVSFEEQVTLFLMDFTQKDWITRRDSSKNCVSLIPSEWSLHQLYRGAFFEFALNVKGEMIFAIGVENPIALGNRIEFKKRLHENINNSLHHKLLLDYDVSLEQRGKFIKKQIPLLSDTFILMRNAVESLFPLIPIVKELIEAFKSEQKIVEEFGVKPIQSKQLSNNSQDDSEIEYEEGESEEYIDYNPDRKIFTNKAEFPVAHLHKLYKRGRLNLQPDFQRQFVWDSAKASSLIESLLLDVPIPVVYLSEDNDGVLSVIDGQQRLCSIFSFIDGHFPDGKSFPLSQLRILRTLNGKSFRDIGSTDQDKLELSTLSTIIIKKESDPELRFDIFERLNTGSIKLNDQELRNCIYRGNYLNLLKQLATDSEFRYLIGLKAPDKRMKDVEYVLRFAAFYHQTYLKYPNSMKFFLNQEMKIYQTITQEQIDDFTSKFHKAVQINKSLLGSRSFRKILCGNSENPDMIWKSSKVVNGALFDLMMVIFIPYDKNMIFRHLDSIREAYIELLTENNEFIDAVEKWTNSPKQIKFRFETFTRILDAIFANDSKQERCFTKDFKESLYKQNDKCTICNQQIISLEDAAIDHVEQYWLGGKTIPSNARLAHRYCNASRKRKE